MRWRQQRDLDLGGAGVALGGGVLGDDLLLGLRVGASGHAQLLSVHVVARRAGACSPGHSRSAAVVRRMTRCPSLDGQPSRLATRRGSPNRGPRLGGRGLPADDVGRHVGRGSPAVREDARMAARSGRVQPVRGDLRAACSPSRRPGRRGSPRSAATPTTRCRAATSAPRRSRSQDIHEDPDRLRRPVRRTGDGWQEIGWDEALDLVAAGLADARSTEHGRDAVAIYLGNPNVHSLGSMTHGAAMVEALRTRNRFSATSVDQLPAQLRRVPDVRPPAAAAGARHRPHASYFLVLGANPLASNGSLMTAPDFPAAAPRRSGARRPDGRDRPAPHRDRAGRRRAPLHPPGHRRRRCCSRCCTCSSPRASPLPPCVRRRARRRREPPSSRFTPERAAAATGIDADVDPAAGPRVRRRRDRGRGATAGSACPRRSSARSCQWAVQLLNVLTGNLDRPGGAMFTRPAVDVVGRGLVGRGAPRRVAEPGARAARVRRRAAGGDAGRGDRRPRARGRSGRCSRWPATRCCPRRTASGSTRRSRGWTSWSRSTSTSTRPPGTRT